MLEPRNSSTTYSHDIAQDTAGTNSGSVSSQLVNDTGAPPKDPIRIFNAAHQEVAILPADHTSDHLDALPANSLYAKLGDGDKVFVTTCLNDAIAVHRKELENSATITPLKPEQIQDVIKVLDSGFPDHDYAILGIREHEAIIAVSKQLLGAKSLYPRVAYTTWKEFVDAEGIESVKNYIQSRLHASQVGEGFAVKQEHVKDIDKQWAIFDNLIISQHIGVICAAPNAGKTTILNWVSSQISERVDVSYINVDCSGSDTAEYQKYADEHGFRFINFDVLQTTAKAFFEELEASPDLTHQVYILDTLKQFCDPMNKTSVKGLFRVLRRLCNRGATFVLLAHTNKHKDKDGLPIFEGVGDIRNDTDELIFLIPESNSDGSKTVSTLPDKKRGPIDPITFQISPNREVSLTDYVDLRKKLRREADAEGIKGIREAIRSGAETQKDIIKMCQEKEIGKRTTLAVLERYDSGDEQLWTKVKGSNNSWRYTLIQ